jgi:hypothetical protein
VFLKLPNKTNIGKQKIKGVGILKKLFKKMPNVNTYKYEIIKKPMDNFLNIKFEKQYLQ